MSSFSNERDKNLQAIAQKYGSGAEIKDTFMIENHSQIQSEKSDAVVEGIFKKDRIQGHPSGLYALDRLIGGIKAQSCIVAAGDTGVGKSLLGISLLVNLARNEGIPVCYIDLENGAEESFERIIGIWHGKPQSWFEDEYNIPQAIEMKKEIDKTFKYYAHDELYDMGFMEQGAALIEKIIEIHAKQGVKVFLIDPLQAIETETNAQANQNEQGYFVRRIKNLAQRTDTSVIILHHLRKSSGGRNKTIEDSEIDDVSETKIKIPDIEDLMGSGKIAHFATGVWLLIRPHRSKERIYREKIVLRVVKNRGGKSGDIYLHLDEDTLRVMDRIEEIEPGF